MTRLIDHTFLFVAVTMAVYSQLIMRWQVAEAGPLPEGLAAISAYVIALLFSPWVFSGLVATLIGGISWMLALTRFELSYAYPFIGLTYVLVMAGGFLFFRESISMAKLAGSVLVITGILLVARG